MDLQVIVFTFYINTFFIFRLRSSLLVSEVEMFNYVESES